jgi:uncharacterized membrane protein
VTVGPRPTRRNLLVLIVGAGVAANLVVIVTGLSGGDHFSPLVQTVVGLTIGTCLLVELAAVVALFIVDAKKRRNS